jgi:hypothetical protein
VPVLTNYEKEWLFNNYLAVIKRPQIFPEVRRQAEDWLADHRNIPLLRQYRMSVEVLLAQEVIPQGVLDLLKEYHDDLVESLLEKDQEEFEQYREMLSPRNILLATT